MFRAGSQNMYLPQLSAGAAVGLLYVAIFSSSPGQKSFRVVLAPVGASRILPGLWYIFAWALDKDMLEVVGSQENIG